MKKLSVLGANCQLGQSKDGVQRGPDTIRYNGLRPLFESLDIAWSDKGNLLPNEAVRSTKEADQELLFNLCQKLAEQVHALCAQGGQSLILGGDHSIGVGTVCGALRHNPNLGVIWVDAHADMNTPLTSPSGNFHGMPLAALLGKFSWPSLSWLDQRLAPSQLVLFGVRDIDPGEQELIREKNILSFSTEDIRREGVSSIWEKINEHFKARGIGSLHLSVDVDGLDPLWAPATGIPVPDGLRVNEVQALIEHARSDFEVNSMDLVELNPIAEGSDLEQTLASTFSIIKAFAREECGIDRVNAPVLLPVTELVRPVSVSLV